MSLLPQTQGIEVVDKVPPPPPSPCNGALDIPLPVLKQEDAAVGTAEPAVTVSPVAVADQVADQATAVAKRQPTDELVSKYTFRKQTWSSFDRNGLVTFPRPVRGRIPNFIGAGEAADKLKATEAFQKAKVVKVNADKPQETVRVYVLDSKEKKLILSARRADEQPLLEIKLPEPPIAGTEPSPAVLRAAVTRQGMLTFCHPLAADCGIKIDLLVVGSVAVSRKGQRIGKCDGYSDLEFGYLCEIGVITPDTIIATTVHDSQVFDELPDELFQRHDFPVDLIVTPTEVIQLAERPPRPNGIMWNLLSKRRMALSAAVSTLHKNLVENGEECHLKDEDTDEEVEKEIRRKHRPFIHRYARRPIRGKPAEEAAHEEAMERERARRSRPRRPRYPSDNNTTTDGERKDSGRRMPARRPFWKRQRILFSIRIGGIASTDRVRDLKNALAARNVRPAEIAWFGRRGFAYVHFAKPRKASETQVPCELDSVVASLKDMKLGEDVEGQEKPAVIVEPAPPRDDSDRPKTAQKITVEPVKTEQDIIVSKMHAAPTPVIGVESIPIPPVA